MFGAFAMASNPDDPDGWVVGNPPLNTPPSIRISDIGRVDADTIFITFESTAANTLHEVAAFSALTPFPFADPVAISGGTLTTDALGAATIEIDVTGAATFFQIQLLPVP